MSQLCIQYIRRHSGSGSATTGSTVSPSVSSQTAVRTERSVSFKSRAHSQQSVICGCSGGGPRVSQQSERGPSVLNSSRATPCDSTAVQLVTWLTMYHIHTHCGLLTDSCSYQSAVMFTALLLSSFVSQQSSDIPADS